MAALSRLLLPCMALALLALAGCATTPAPVIDRSPGELRSDRTADDEHIVQRGDTVFAIAFRNSIDWREFASWNGLVTPYTIYVGQRLRLSPPAGWRREAAVDQTASISQPPDSSVRTRPVVEEDQPARVESLGPSTAPATVQTIPEVAPAQPGGTTTEPPVLVRTPSIDPPPTPSATTPLGPAAATRVVGGIAWRWPASGALLRTFAAADPLRQGVDIAGSAGDPVYAAADGEVVYSGAGLVGYGELVIIKHSAQFLSAYGHNRSRLVSEGQTVKAGQQIAEMGRTGTDREKLHFEIRRGGRPVNPADHLPSR